MADTQSKIDNPQSAIPKFDPKTDGSTTNIVEQNVAKLKELFPDIVTEGEIDFDALRETLGNYIDDRQERYSFTWNGKGLAKRIAQTPSTGTLRPCPEDSVNWETTQNLFIEGDNLEVLKLLQKSYHKRVKMIYIDPPYNTGREFIYPDRFQDNLDTYLRYTGQIDETGFKLSANAETSGRYHTNWLNMMLPRLKLARNLLREDGVIFITIDDCEEANLRKLCDEVFGEENFVALVSWQKRVSPANDAHWFSSDQDNVLVYARNKEGWSPNRLPLNERQRGYYTNPDADPRGPWNSATYTCSKTKDERPNLYYPVVNPNTGEEIWPKETAVWKYSQEVFEAHVRDKLIYWGQDGNAHSPRIKTFLSESKGVVPRTVWSYQDVGHTQEATQQLQTLLPNSGFDTPKPVRLIRHMLQIGTSTEDEAIVLDFFAGSCSLAHGILDLNAQDHGNRRFVVVQLPEPCDKKSLAYRSGFTTIAEIGKERIRRVISTIEAEQLQKAGKAKGKLPGMAEDVAKMDLGFKVFKLDASNIKPWDVDFDNVKEALLNAVENIKPDRTEADVLYELLLKYGLDLAVPIEERKIDGKTVYIIGAGALIVCLADKVSLNVVEGIAKLKAELKPEVMRVVFKDAGFKDDVVKTNAVQILRQAGIEDVKSL